MLAPPLAGSPACYLPSLIVGRRSVWVWPPLSNSDVNRKASSFVSVCCATVRDVNKQESASGNDRHSAICLVCVVVNDLSTHGRRVLTVFADLQSFGKWSSPQGFFLSLGSIFYLRPLM